MAHLHPKSFPHKHISLTPLSENSLSVTWHGVGSYDIHSGSQITVAQEEGSCTDQFLQPFYSLLPAALLTQREYLVLHGNAVDIDGKAVVLVGNKGLGKSTITAALLSRNHRLIADDVTAINTTPQHFDILPGIPNLKIWPDTAKATGIDFSKLTRINSFIEKYNYHIPHHFCERKIQLAAIFFLDHGERPQIEEIPPNKSILWLIANNYFSRYPHAISSYVHKRTFKQSTQLAKKTKIFKLSYPRNLDLLYESITLIESKL